MVEKVEFTEDEKVLIKNNVNSELSLVSSKYINLYYRAEGTFVFSLITLLLVLFLWDDIQSSLFYFLFSTILQFLLMLFFIFMHFKQKGTF